MIRDKELPRMVFEDGEEDLIKRIKLFMSGQLIEIKKKGRIRNIQYRPSIEVEFTNGKKVGIERSYGYRMLCSDFDVNCWSRNFTWKHGVDHGDISRQLAGKTMIYTSHENKIVHFCPYQKGWENKPIKMRSMYLIDEAPKMI